jgi:hypothetical protein
MPKVGWWSGRRTRMVYITEVNALSQARFDGDPDLPQF